MKEINPKDVKALRWMSGLLAVMMIIIIITPIPLAKFLGWWGMAVYLVLFAVALTVALIIEKRKKANNISTFKEIDAFMSGKQLDEIESLKEEAKRPYQRFLAVIISAAIALAVTALMDWLLK